MLLKDFKQTPYVWVNLKAVTNEQFTIILENIKISRYATGGLPNINMGIKDIVGDMSFWDKLVYCPTHKWRIGGKIEGVVDSKEIFVEDMFSSLEVYNKLMAEKWGNYVLRGKDEYVNNCLADDNIETLYYSDFTEGYDIGNLEGIVYSSLTEAKRFRTKEHAQSVINLHNIGNIFEVVADPER